MGQTLCVPFQLGFVLTSLQVERARLCVQKDTLPHALTLACSLPLRKALV